MHPLLDSLPPYPFQRLERLLADLSPPEESPLALSIGEPQDAPPPLIAETLAAHAADWRRYPPTPGMPDLRAAIVEALCRRYALPAESLDPDRHVLPLAGTREGIYLLHQLLLGPAHQGAGVLMPNPFYQVYLGGAVMAGGRAMFLDTGPETGFLPDLEALPTDVLSRARLMWLCSPSNPEGAVASAAYLEQALTLARRHDLILACDECYADLYDGPPPPGALAVAGGRFHNLLVFHSLSKRSNAAGLRSGFVAGDPAVIAAFRRLRAYGGATLPLPVQAASAALWRDDAHVAATRARTRERYALAAAAGLPAPRAGFFLWLAVGDGEAAARHLWQRAGLRVVPGAYLAQPGASGPPPGHDRIRVALVHDPAVLGPALRRLAAALDER